MNDWLLLLALLPVFVGGFALTMLVIVVLRRREDQR